MSSFFDKCFARELSVTDPTPGFAPWVSGGSGCCGVKGRMFSVSYDIEHAVARSVVCHVSSTTSPSDLTGFRTSPVQPALAGRSAGIRILQGDSGVSISTQRRSFCFTE